jgi:hypothetical protein
VIAIASVGNEAFELVNWAIDLHSQGTDTLGHAVGRPVGEALGEALGDVNGDIVGL